MEHVVKSVEYEAYQRARRALYAAAHAPEPDRGEVVLRRAVALELHCRLFYGPNLERYRDGVGFMVVDHPLEKMP